MSHSLSLREIVDMQQGFHWNVFYQPLGFLIFLICAFAECNRAPFDLPESESELIGGYHTEYSSMKLGFICLRNISTCLFPQRSFPVYFSEVIISRE